MNKFLAFLNNVNPKVFAGGAATLPAVQLSTWLLAFVPLDWAQYSNLHNYAVGAVSGLFVGVAAWLKRDTRVAAAVQVLDQTPVVAAAAPIVDETPVEAAVVTPETPAV